MRFLICCAQKTKDKSLLKAEAEYIKRLTGQFAIDFFEYADTKQLFSKTKNNTYTIVLDERGESLSSQQLGRLLEDQAVRGRSHFTFIIGGPDGLESQVKERGDTCLSLSKLTFTYQMTRLILIEQLYRVAMIMKGTRYHK